jgi:serine/threonine protein kinase
MELERTYTPVVARISSHILRLEREYHLSQSFTQSSDPEYKHSVRLIDIVKLPSRQGDSPAIASIFESPGRNYLQNLIDFGPTWSPGFVPGLTHELSEHSSADKISLASFLDFAIGACECLELLHELRIVHGEIRGDAFYFDEENQVNPVVKIINFGAGPRSFENGFTSAGWLALTKEAGVQRKLQFIAPEQTGRMPAEPDSRTDIYSLGVLLWTMITKQPAFHGDTPLDIIQAVLARRKLPAISSIRMDIPKVIEDVIRKMTRKQIDERYHSMTGLKHDLLEVRKLLQDGNREGLANLEIGLKDVSSFFVLPTLIFGRINEYDIIFKAIQKVYKRRMQVPLDKGRSGAVFNTQSASTISDGRLDILESDGRSSITSSDADKGLGRVRARSLSVNLETRALQSDFGKGLDKSTASSKLSKPSTEDKEPLMGSVTSDQQSKALADSGSARMLYSNGASSILRQTNRSGRKRCEVVTIVGAAGLGKSSLIQNTQSWVRGLGYCASAKFDQAKKAPFGPLLRVLGSLFRQIFSEGDVDTSYHNCIRDKVHPLWPTLCTMLDLPENLMSVETQQNPQEASDLPSWRLTRNPGIESSRSASSVSNHSSVGTKLTPNKANNTTQSSKVLKTFVEVLRVLSAKLICLCFDDLQFADEESLDLLSNIISRKLGIVLIVSL